MKHFMHLTILLIILRLLFPESTAAVNNLIESRSVTPNYISNYTYDFTSSDGPNYSSRSDGCNSGYIYLHDILYNDWKIFTSRENVDYLPYVSITSAPSLFPTSTDSNSVFPLEITLFVRINSQSITIGT